jgi:hypothetical protein
VSVGISKESKMADSPWRYINKLAEAPFKSAEKLEKQSPFIQKMNKIVEKVGSTPGMEAVMPMVGMTRGEIGKDFLKTLFKKSTKLAPEETKELSNALRVLGGLPRKTIKEINSFDFPAEAFGGHTGISGAYLPLTRDVKLIPVGGEHLYHTTLPGDLAHEAGHLSGDILGQRMSKLGDMYSSRALREGIAEYLGQGSLKKSKVLEAPIFAYPGQKTIFEDLSSMPSKNPYMNVYRYLQQVTQRGVRKLGVR